MQATLPCLTWFSVNCVGRWQLEKAVDVRHPGALGAKSQDLGSNSGHFQITPDSRVLVPGCYVLTELFVFIPFDPCRDHGWNDCRWHPPGLSSCQGSLRTEITTAAGDIRRSVHVGEWRLVDEHWIKFWSPFFFSLLEHLALAWHGKLLNSEFLQLQIARIFTTMIRTCGSQRRGTLGVRVG